LWQNKKIKKNCHSFVAKIFFLVKLPQVICYVYFLKEENASQKFEEALFDQKHVSVAKPIGEQLFSLLRNRVSILIGIST
jgi:hypothetical protein